MPRSRSRSRSRSRHRRKDSRSRSRSHSRERYRPRSRDDDSDDDRKTRYNPQYYQQQRRSSDDEGDDDDYRRDNARAYSHPPDGGPGLGAYPGVDSAARGGGTSSSGERYVRSGGGYKAYQSPTSTTSYSQQHQRTASSSTTPQPHHQQMSYPPPPPGGPPPPHGGYGQYQQPYGQQPGQHPYGQQQGQGYYQQHPQQQQPYGQYPPPQHGGAYPQNYPPPPGPPPPQSFYAPGAHQAAGYPAGAGPKPASQGTGYHPNLHIQTVAPQQGGQAYNPATYEQDTKVQPPLSPVEYQTGQYKLPSAYAGSPNTFPGYPDAPTSQVRPPSQSDDTGSPKPPKEKKGGFLSSLTSKLAEKAHDAARQYFPATSTHIPYLPGGVAGGIGGDAGELHTNNRFDSFAPARTGNGVKWYVEGRDYMHAVSVAIENAKETIWIMDWWLSPELYLRRPPAQNEQYRLDRMLLAAAQRGVSVRIMVYKEVEQALTLDSHHTKKALEKLHENISVLRHPDHIPDLTNIAAGFQRTFADGYQAGDVLKSIYGVKDGKVLFWAHHEKMLLVDGLNAFVGGLDLCFGRWDTNEHPIADAHPDDVRDTIWPGQDYNNCRVMDFHDVRNYNENKVSRLEYPRAGWTDVALSFQGPACQDLKIHFVERWNFIHDEKYKIRNNKRYPRIELTPWPLVNDGLPLGHSRPGSSQGVGHEAPWDKFGHGEHRDRFKHKIGHKIEQKLLGGSWTDGVKIQVLRSASKWSHGTETTEHSICNAYIATILNAEHFVYIENQFFITASGDKQNPLLNQIGTAIVQRITRAHEERKPFRMIVIIPAVPGFAGDLKDDGSLGTRAIMEFQYRSINNDRGYSIMESLQKKGIKAEDYITFWNLRNYDRINTTSKDNAAYNQASAAFAQQHGAAGYGGYPGGPQQGPGAGQYAPPGGQKGKTPASVAHCMMLNGPDIRSLPWGGTPEEELDAFVQEQVYIHSKLLIADDRTVIMGSANINDRSQLGDHDSEIAVIVEDPTPLHSSMGGRPFTASNFAGTLRRQIFRKHLGLIPGQIYPHPTPINENMLPFPAPNLYDFRSQADHLVADPLSPTFWNYWLSLAHTNTLAYRKLFHAVPDDTVTSWAEYDEFFWKHFRAEVKDGNGKVTVEKGPEKVGHIVKSEWKDVREVKEVLAGIRGHLVEMPLRFLCKEDIAQEGVGLNAFTETIYT